MYASTAGGGAMSLVFKPAEKHGNGPVTAVKLPERKRLPRVKIVAKGG